MPEFVIHTRRSKPSYRTVLHLRALSNALGYPPDAPIKIWLRKPPKLPNRSWPAHWRRLRRQLQLQLWGLPKFRQLRHLLTRRRPTS